MPIPKPAATNNKDKEERASQRKLWGVLSVLLLLVTGIVYAPPFARDHHTSDFTNDRPKVTTKDEPQSDSADTGAVLGQSNKPSGPRIAASNKAFPSFVPTPTPEPHPLAPPVLPTLPVKPELPTPDIEPEVPPIDEPVVCDAPEIAEGEVVLTATTLEFDRYADPYGTVYVAVAPQNCPVAWEALNTDETVFWPGDDTTGKSLPAMMVIESDRNAETGMHHGNALKFRFKVGDSGQPVYEHQFNFALHTEGNPTPTPYTITVRVITPEDETCYDESCLPPTPVEDTQDPEPPIDESETPELTITEQLEPQTTEPAVTE